MDPKALPIFNIELFQYRGKEDGFYANTIAEHLKKFEFVFHPHRHDFFVTILCTSGTGTHTIDFVEYPVRQGYVFMLSPGQAHRFDVSRNIGGYVFFHTKDFYELNFVSRKVKDYPFFCSAYNTPMIRLKNGEFQRFSPMFADLVREYRQDYLLKYRKLCSAVDLLYIELSRLYLPLKMVKRHDHTYLGKISILEDLIEDHFRETHSASDYARMMNMSERHLNRICRITLNKKVSDLIFDRIILEAKRLLVHGDYSVSEVAGMLGYLDHSYFSRLFKKRTGESPAVFIKRQRS